jgi:hypothetical protein
MNDKAQVTERGAIINMIAAVSSRPTKQNKTTCSRMPRAYSSLRSAEWVKQFTYDEDDARERSAAK